PLLLQEIGYPASPENGSSEQKQAQFIDEVFKQLETLDSKVPFASFFLQTDFGTAQLDAFTGYYGVSEASFRSFLGSLGLHDSTGKPRQAWNVFTRECLKLKPVE
ncbi:MAG TPA: hypothetical protein VG944_23695, partial [Fimbriimonas sp.]|nr:hypothetical protein [Fimbriimonas sp.]